MRKPGYYTISIILYFVSLLSLGYYIGITLTPNVIMEPSARIILLCTSSIGIYFGSVTLTKTTNEKTKKKIMKSGFLFFFLLYAVLLSNFTLFDTMFGRRLSNIFMWDKETFQNTISLYLNLIPFKTILMYLKGFFTATMSTKIVITNLVGNIIAFAPFAFFIPLLFKRINTYFKFLAYLMIIVLAVELLQLISLSGSFDVDDIILNVGGASIFYYLFHIKWINRLINKVTMLEYSPVNQLK